MKFVSLNWLVVFLLMNWDNEEVFVIGDEGVLGKFYYCYYMLLYIILFSGRDWSFKCYFLK